MNGVNDPDNHKRLSKPRESVTVANADITAFTAAVTKLRQKHRIPEVVVICAVRLEDGTKILEGSISLGDAATSRFLAARYLANEMTIANTERREYEAACKKGDMVGEIAVELLKLHEAGRQKDSPAIQSARKFFEQVGLIKDENETTAAEEA